VNWREKRNGVLLTSVPLRVASVNSLGNIVSALYLLPILCSQTGVYHFLLSENLLAHFPRDEEISDWRRQELFH